MISSNRMDRIAFKVLVYMLLVSGSVIFCWPLVWMISSSIKADKELFTQTQHIFPQSPLAQQKSPYVDQRYFDDVNGPRMREILPVLEKHMDSLHGVWPEDMDRHAVVKQLARGAYKRLIELLPTDTWTLSKEALEAEALKRIDSAMVTDLLQQIRRSLLIGQLRARSYDLQEDQLVATEDAAKAWTIQGPANAYLQNITEGKQSYAELHYDFSSGDSFKLSKTFRTSFPISRLYRIQLSLQSDESWHPLATYVEKEGNLYEAVKVSPMSDSVWSVLSWQELGPDDATNKIRNWINLKKIDSGPNYEHDPHKIKVILEFGSVDPMMAWYYKIQRNYRLVFDNMPFWHYAATSVFLVILNLVGTLFSCSLVAYSFARLRWPGRGMSYALMLATMMVPAQVTMIPFFLIVRWLGWYNTLYPLWVGSFFASAFNVFLLHQFFKGIPTDLEDAAKIDGCGPLRIYWYIMLPLIKPALATIAIFTFMGVWNNFMDPLIYVSDQRLYPLSLGLYALKVQSGSSMAIMNAGSLLMILPVVLIFFFLQRYFIEGITMTGLKS